VPTVAQAVLGLAVALLALPVALHRLGRRDRRWVVLLAAGRRVGIAGLAQRIRYPPLTHCAAPARSACRSACSWRSASHLGNPTLVGQRDGWCGRRGGRRPPPAASAGALARAAVAGELQQLEGVGQPLVQVDHEHAEPERLLVAAG
jgi:hypothetical protein